MRVAAAILALPLLGGCGDAGLSPLPTDQVRARFPPGGVVDVIEVDAVDRLPLRKAELIAPDGQATPASSLNVNPSPSQTFYQEFSSGPYAGSGNYPDNAFGVGKIGSGALFPAQIGAPQTRAELLAMLSTASIPLLDAVAYRREWRSYRIRLSFGDPPGEVETREIAAPGPPPNS